VLSRILRIHYLVLALTLLATSAWSTYSSRQIAPGVTFTQDICVDAQSALITNVITVDPSAPGVALKAAVGQDVVMTDDWRKGREAISLLTARKGALVGVNADFFPFTGDPLGVCIVDSQLISEPARGRVAMAVLRNKAVFFDNPRFNASIKLASGPTRQIDGVNRVRETNQLIAYTGAFGATTQNKHKATDIVCTSPDLLVQAGKSISLTVVEVKPDAVNTPIPKGGIVLSAGGPAGYFLKENLKPGDTLTARFEIKSDSCYDWTEVENAVGGGPWLVKDGRVFVDAQEQGFDARFSSTCHPRTAVGLRADGKLLVVTVDGRQSISGGISLTDLANVMIRLGATNAINLDGGGSTSLSVRGLLVNSVSDADERLVANALLVYASPEPQEQLSRLAITGVTPEVVSGQGAQLSLVSGDDGKPLSAEQLSKVVWGTTNAVGFVNQMGYFTPGKIRKGTVNALYGSQLVSVPINVIGGPPARVRVDLTPDKQDPARATLSVTVYDAGSNLLAGKEVLLNAVGGKPDGDSGVTNEKGVFTTGITWDATSQDRVVAAVAGSVTGEARPTPNK
jgi:hypothetical protein